MTLNQVLKRIEIMAMAHKQLRQYEAQIDVVEFLNDKGAKLPCCLVQDIPGNMYDLPGKQIIYTLRIFLLDGVHQNKNTSKNAKDVQSDMMSVGADLISEIAFPGYTDWMITAGAPVQILQEAKPGLFAGVAFDLTINTAWDINVCSVPTDSFEFPIIDDMTDKKLVYDTVYVANGNEGGTLTIPEIQGKRILLMVREGFTQYKVNTFDDSNITTQYLWEASDEPLVNINLGLPTNAGERFLILYRNI